MEELMTELQNDNDDMLTQFSSKLQELVFLANQMPDHLKGNAKMMLEKSYSECLDPLEKDNSSCITHCPSDITIKAMSTVHHFLNTVESPDNTESTIYTPSLQTTDTVCEQAVDDSDALHLQLKASDVTNTLINTNCTNSVISTISCAENREYAENESLRETMEDMNENGITESNMNQGQSEERISQSVTSNGNEAWTKDDLSDMSSLLTFLPQLSPYIKLDMKTDGSGSTEGFIHLTVERADGSLQNLKVGGLVTGTPELSQQEPSRTDEYDGTLDGDAKVADNEEKDQDAVKIDAAVSLESSQFIDRSSPVRSRGRPKKKTRIMPETDKNGTKMYICSVCGASVKTEHALIVHLRTHTGDRPFSCQYCGKLFTTKGNAKAHEVTHSQEKPWVCQYCQKSFKEKKVLKIHERKHTGEKPFKCSLCNKAFTQKSVLNEHMLIHTGQKPHLCDLCGQEFRGLSSLRAHTRRHMNKRDFKCDKCDKDFISKNDLNRHYITHTGARPFACHICPKTFTRLNYLKEHLNIHNGCKPFNCQWCSASFPDSMSLHRHRQKHQLEEEEEEERHNIGIQSELEKELLSAGNDSGDTETSFHKIEITDPSILDGSTSVQVILDENTQAEDLQRLHSLVLSAGNTVDFTVSLQQTPKHHGQVMCINPNTQDLTDPLCGHQLILNTQNAADFSAINLLANATAQQYNI